MSEPKVIGYIKRNNGIRGPGFAEWQEPVYEVSPSPDAGTGTPETDEALKQTSVLVNYAPSFIAFARSLESRLAEALAENAALLALVKGLPHSVICNETGAGRCTCWKSKI